MYGKVYQTMYTGSLYGSPPIIFAVWGYAIANAHPPGLVELNPKLLAGIFATSEAEIEATIATLCGPDPRSRTKDNEGRRLIRRGEYEYFVPTHERYRNYNQVETFRRNAALRAKRYRARKKARGAV